ncbi:MAG: dTDP-4-dehydrorhamnose reductase, partial [Thermoguttaceae bacterium]|nr:dTDP-4-dehydrorhamnose reductase [Thermoguttaceae bacterium]
FYDEVRTPTYVDEMARVFRVFLANGYAGVLNCGGPRQVSLYQMAQIINWTGGFERDLLFGQYREEYCPVPPRVSNCAMDSSKLTEILGFTPFSPWPALPEFWPSDRQWHLTRPDAFHGSTPLMNRLLSFSPRLYPAGADYYANLF